MFAYGDLVTKNKACVCLTVVIEYEHLAKVIGFNKD